MKKFLVAGLGNIGAEYAETRHNIGFKVLDFLADKSGTFFSNKRYADVAQYALKGRTFVLIKPTTFMNLSGKALNYWLREEKIPLEHLLVVLDDIALPFGALRLKTKGSDGGHNGLKSINQVLGRQDYARLRFGIDGNFPKGRQIEYVLGTWSEEENQALNTHIERAAKAIESFALAGPALTMNQYNG